MQFPPALHNMCTNAPLPLRILLWGNKYGLADTESHFFLYLGLLPPYIQVKERREWHESVKPQIKLHHKNRVNQRQV